MRKRISGKTPPKSSPNDIDEPDITPYQKIINPAKFPNEDQEGSRKCHTQISTLRTIDPSAPSTRFADIIDRLPHRHTSHLFQLRTGHAPLDKYLHHIAKSPTATCQQCNEGNESVHHFLFPCPTYTRQRNILRLELGTMYSTIRNV